MLLTAGVWIRSRPSQEPHIFVVGAPRSGTTLLRNILIAHSSLAGTDRESTGLIRVRDFAKFQIGELSEQLWRDMLKQTRGLPGLFDRLAAELMAANSARRFVDKINVAAWRLAYVKRFFPEARFVCIVRDGRDSLCSARRHPNVHQSGSVASYARYWKKCVELPGKILPSPQTHNLRYEDLVVDPVAVIEATMQFLEMKFEKDQVAVKSYSKVSSVKKRSVHRNLAKPINASSVNRWQSELSKVECRQFTKVARKALQHWGYAT